MTNTTFGAELWRPSRACSSFLMRSPGDARGCRMSALRAGFAGHQVKTPPVSRAVYRAKDVGKDKPAAPGSLRLPFSRGGAETQRSKKLFFKVVHTASDAIRCQCHVNVQQAAGTAVPHPSLRLSASARTSLLSYPNDRSRRAVIKKTAAASAGWRAVTRPASARSAESLLPHRTSGRSTTPPTPGPGRR